MSSISLVLGEQPENPELVRGQMHAPPVDLDRTLLEIEACLMRQPGVATAVCVALELVPGSRQLRAAVTLDPDGPEPGDLRATLAELLPEASVPAAVSVLPGLPRTPSGKIDRDSVAKSLSPGGER